MPISIIGAGISGISLAIKCEKKNIEYTIYEMSDYIGGLWNKKMGIVNEYSNVQVISPTFKFEDDNSIYSQYTGSQEMYQKIEDNCNKFNIRKNIKFNTKVLNFESLENDKVKLTLQNTIDNTISTILTDALYIRTGTLNKVRQLTLPGENNFKGVINYGTNKDIDFKDKVVTIIGIGATAVENINNAFKKGAKKVIVLARHVRNMWTRKIVHQTVMELISPSHYLHSCFRKNSWNRVNNLYNKVFDSFDNDITNKIREHSFDDQMNQNMSNIPVLTEDILIYLHYGLLEIHLDEVNNLNDHTVYTKKGINFNTDMILKCTGYELNNDIFENHTLDNTIFVDGKHNITHNCGLDRSGKYKFFMGPNTNVNILPLVSYPLVNHIFDELALYYLEYPNRYQVFISNKDYNDIISNKTIDDIELRCFVHMFWKLISHLKVSPLDIRLTYRIGIHLWNLRSDMLNNLDTTKFNTLDKTLWDETSKFCHQKKPEVEYLEYPY